MAFVSVARDGDLKDGQMRTVEANGKKIVVARAGGRLYAFDSACTHRGGPLGDGSLDKTTVICPWHGGSFDLATGQPVNPPATVPIKTYAAKAENGRILVDA